MSWSGFTGHREVLERFRRILGTGRLASAYLFCGPSGVGKFTFAWKLAKTLLCEGDQSTEWEPCGTCSACRQVDALTNPDLMIVRRPADKNFIPVELLIGPDERRMKEGLCYELGLKPFRGGRKIAIIDDADALNQEGANCLLKTLEEPPPRSLLILIGTSSQKQLPTIRSRCQRVPFGPLSAEEMVQILLAGGLADSPEEARRLADTCGGSFERAALLKDEELSAFRQAWLQQLAGGDPGADGFAQRMTGVIEAAGSDGAARRERMRLITEWAIEFYRQVLWRSSGVSAEAEPALKTAAARAVERLSMDALLASQCLARCLDAQGEIAANVNPALWTGCLLSELGRLSRGEFVTVEYA